MPRHLSRARGRRAAAVAAAAVAAMTGSRRAGASLTINLQFPGGETTELIGGDQTNTSVPIQVWATVTGTNSVTPTPVAGSTATAPVTTGGDFDGLQYLYYNVLNSNSTTTEINGSVGSVVLNSTLGFNANGSQVGVLANVANGISVGSNTSIGSIAKPRSSKAVFDNFATYNQTSGTYQEYGNDGVNIKVSGNSVSFLVETVNYVPSAYTQLTKTTFSVSIPSAAFVAANSVYEQANWFEDTTNQANASSQGQPTPVSGNKDGTPVAGTSVVIEDTLAGDTNLDGTVNFTDLTTVLQHFNTATSGFANGDFNNDGEVNFTDLTALLQNFNVSILPVTPSIVQANAAVLADPQAVALLESYNLYPELSTSSVPEPACAGCVVWAGAALLGRWRRRARRALTRLPSAAA
jgi:hypothetical protein